MKKKYGITIAIFAMLVLAVMVIIFCFSAETAAQSSRTSNGVTKLIIKIVKPDFDTLSAKEKADFFSQASHFVRKAAHFSESFLLGLFSSLLLLSVLRLIERKVGLFVIIPPIFCFLYALFDEGHQQLVGGRSGQFSDVLIDTAGALVAIALVTLIYLFVSIKRRKSLS